jgi:hypothetical protein
MSEYQLGDRVTMTGTVEKVRVEEWTRYTEGPLVPDYRTHGRPPYAEGIVVGQRTLTEGTTTPSVPASGLFGEYDYEPAKFHAATSRVAYLVAFDLHRKPCLCLPEQLTRKDADHE